MLKALKNSIGNYLMRHLFNAITVDQAVEVSIYKTQDGKQANRVKVGSRELAQGEVENLGREARILLEMPLWRLIQDHLKSDAINQLAYKSKVVDDLVFAKALLYNLEVQQKLLEKIALL